MITATFEPSTPRPALPRGAKLHEHVRASVPRKGNHPPEAFAVTRERLDALEKAKANETIAMQELLRIAFAQGVPVSTLARWSGYTPRWVGIIVDGESS